MYHKDGFHYLKKFSFFKNVLFFIAITISIIPSASSLEKNLLPQDPKERIIKFFNLANFSNMKSLCEEFYHPNLIFEDPLGTINGRDEMIKYYLNLYKNVIDIRFEFKDSTTSKNTHMLSWVMYLKSKSLKSGKEIKLEGVSHLKFDPQTGLAIYHRDYFDMGAFIYEHIPIVGSLIHYIKSKLSDH